jgi:type IV pilus assembly protein PilV
LIEAMVALVVFTIGILGVMQMNIIASAQNGLASRETVAAAIGRDLVDTFERIPYGHAALAAGTHTYRSDWGLEAPLLGASGAIIQADGRINATTNKHAVTWTVEERTNAAGQVEAKLITISITFRVPGAVTKSVNVYTAKYNPNVMVGPGSGFLEI